MVALVRFDSTLQLSPLIMAEIVTRSYALCH